MQCFLGEEAVTKSWQDDFPKRTDCCRCDGDARIAFVAFEGARADEYVCRLHENGKDGKLWPHDAVAVAVYFCEKCLEPTALYNQA